MKVFLAVLFFMNGEPALIDGFMPREQPSIEVCEERAEFMQESLADMPDLPEVGKIVCGTKEDIQKAINSLQGDLT